MRLKVAVAVPALALAVCASGCDGGTTSVAGPMQGNVPAPTSLGSTHTSGTTPTTGTAPASGSTHKPSDQIKLSPSSSAQIVAWYHGAGGAAFTSLTKTLDRVSRAEAMGTAAFGRECPEITAAVSTALGKPEIPAANASKWYTHALAEYNESATVCQAGVLANDTPKIRQAEAGVNAANVALNRAAAILITALSRQ